MGELEKAYYNSNSSPKSNEVSNLENYEDDSNLFMRKNRALNSKSSTFKRSYEGNMESFDALISAIINLTYLRRSIVKKLLNQPRTIENKVVGYFFRMKLK